MNIRSEPHPGKSLAALGGLKCGFSNFVAVAGLNRAGKSIGERKGCDRKQEINVTKRGRGNLHFSFLAWAAVEPL